MPEKKEKPIVIELYELWNSIKARFAIVSPQPQSFTLRTEVIPTIALDGEGFLGLKQVDLSSTGTIAPGGSLNQTIIPPVGQVYVLAAVFCQAANPIGSTAGAHALRLHLDTINELSDLLKVIGNSGTDIYITQDSGLIGDDEHPSATSSQYDRICGDHIIFGNTDYMHVKYENDMDVDKTGTITLEFLFKVYRSVL